MWCALWFAAAACGESRAAPRTDSAADLNSSRDDVGGMLGQAAMRDTDIPVVTASNAVQSLAFAAGRNPRAYRMVRDTSVVHAGTVTGNVVAPIGVVTVSSVEPTHDRSVCKPFTDTLIPSVNGGVGNAVVWLVGVTSGPAPNAPRRAALSLQRCRLEPRVQRAAVGGTLQITSRDAMSSRLRFLDVGGKAVPRVLVPFTDDGQVVPTSAASQTPGLVEVRDDLHPWVRGYVAIAPHPFVAVTPATGRFRFDGVPPGTYTLVVWQEKLGVRTQVVRVSGAIETRVRMAFE